MINLIKKNTDIRPLLYFLVLITLVTLLWFNLPEGIYLGGDWTFPVNEAQVEKFYHPYTWSSNSNFGEPSIISLVGLIYRYFIYILVKIGFPINILPKYLILVILIIGYIFEFKLLKYIGFSSTVSYIGASIYVLSPTYFNYIPMGWIYAIIAMSLFPACTYCMLRAIDTKKLIYLFYFSVIWSISTMQSQSIVWIPLLLVPIGFYKINSFVEFINFFKYILITVIIYFLINLYWIGPLLIFGDENISSNQIVNASSSLGADSVFAGLNSIRLWGGLFNQQYETILIGNGFEWISWLIPLIAILSIKFSKNSKLVLAYSIIGFIFTLSILILRDNREVLVSIPGGGLLRHLGRFSTIITFSYIILICSSFEYFLKLSIHKFIKSIFIFIFILIYTIPVYTFQLTNASNVLTVKDIRLRVKTFPQEYYDAEKYLLNEGTDGKVIFLPYGMGASYNDDPIFNGIFKEAIDPFAAFSPVPGQFIPSERPSANIEYLNFIGDNLNIFEALSESNINYYILRKNIEPGSSGFMIANHREIFKSLNKSFENDKLVIYKHYKIKPLVFIANNIYLSTGSISKIHENFKKYKKELNDVYVSIDQNQHINRLNKETKLESKIDEISYKKINDTEYDVKISGANNSILMIFGEGFSKGWKIFPEDNINNNSKNFKNYVTNELGVEYKINIIKSVLNNKNLEQKYIEHLKVNGHQNGWLINIEELCGGTGNYCTKNPKEGYDIRIKLKFWPQWLFDIMLVASFSMLIMSYIFIRNHDKYKQ